MKAPNYEKWILGGVGAWIVVTLVGSWGEEALSTGKPQRFGHQVADALTTIIKWGLIGLVIVGIGWVLIKVISASSGRVGGSGGGAHGGNGARELHEAQREEQQALMQVQREMDAEMNRVRTAKEQEFAERLAQVHRIQSELNGKWVVKEKANAGGDW